MIRWYVFMSGAVLFFLAAAGVCARDDVKRIVFEEQRIEGKIRRPQLVLITADQRPQFPTMVMQSLGKSGSITSSVSDELLDDSPYKKAFRFDGTKISNYNP